MKKTSIFRVTLVPFIGIAAYLWPYLAVAQSLRNDPCRLIDEYRIGMSLESVKELRDKRFPPYWCSLSRPISGKERSGECKGLIEISGVQIMAQFGVSEGKLVTLLGEFEQSNFYEIRSAFLARFGKPEVDEKCDDPNYIRKNGGYKLLPELVEKSKRAGGCEGLFWKNNGTPVMIQQIDHKFSIISMPEKSAACPSQRSGRNDPNGSSVGRSKQNFKVPELKSVEMEKSSDVTYDIEEVRRTQMMDEAIAQMQSCMRDASAGQLQEGVRNRDQIYRYSIFHCAELLKPYLTKEFIRDSAENALNSIPGVK